MFIDGINSDDIVQGTLGDCYFLSTLASLAVKPERVRKLFTTQEKNDEGIYAVKISKNGIPIEVVIDDFIPVGEYGMPAFTQSVGNEMWVVLMEKAYAKVHGSYDRLRSGWPHDAARDITGAIGYQYSDYDSDEVF